MWVQLSSGVYAPVFAGVRHCVHIRLRAEDVVQMGVQQRRHTQWICRLLNVLLRIEFAES